MLDEFTDYKIFQTQKCSENNTNDTHSNLAYITFLRYGIRNGGGLGGLVTKSCPTLAWKIPWMEEPGRLQSVGSRRVGHN